MTLTLSGRTDRGTIHTWPTTIITWRWYLLSHIWWHIMTALAIFRTGVCIQPHISVIFPPFREVSFFFLVQSRDSAFSLSHKSHFLREIFLLHCLWYSITNQFGAIIHIELYNDIDLRVRQRFFKLFCNVWWTSGFRLNQVDTGSTIRFQPKKRVYFWLRLFFWCSVKADILTSGISLLNTVSLSPEEKRRRKLCLLITRCKVSHNSYQIRRPYNTINLHSSNCIVWL